LDWLAAATYNVTDDITGYVTVATGSRPKGITTIVNSIYQLQEIPEEELTSYEVGLKTEFFDHRLRANLTGFYSDYSKRRTAQIEYQCLADSPPYTPMPLASDCPPGGVLPWYITVARPATIKGVEFELTSEPIEGLLLEFGGGYNHFVDGVKTPGLPGYIVPGNLPQPEWNTNAGIQYDMMFLGGTLTPRLDWNYQSKSTYNPASALTAPSAQYTVPGRSIFNARVTFKPENSKWSFVVAATNLTNKYYLYELFTGSTVATAGVVAPPREFSFELRRDF
jgi:iron complex outermembrane recepter protein